MFKCMFCDKEFEEETSLIRHASRVHHISPDEMRVKLHHGGVWPTCECGCGLRVNYNKLKKEFCRFHRGHQTRDEKIRETMIDAGRVAASDQTKRKLNSTKVKERWKSKEYSVLKKGSRLVINIDEKNINTIMKSALLVGFEHEKTMKIILKRDHFSRSKGITESNLEPVLIFNK